MSINVTSILFKDFVDEGVVPLENFVVTKSEISSSPPDGGVLLETLFISVDPYMRSRMRPGKGYSRAAFQPGQPLESLGIAKIVESKASDFQAGDYLTGMLPWQTHIVLANPAESGLRKVQPPANGHSAGYYLTLLGMPALTAYASLREIAEPKEGEVAFVSGAAGAVGHVVGQLLKNVYGLKTVIGSAGTDEKVEFLKKVGFDHAFNYKTTSAKEALKKFAPDGIDIYYDNVGGETLDAALEAARVHARFVECGMISQYNDAPQQRYGLKNVINLIGQRIRMQGFIVGDLAPKYFGDFVKDMPKWANEGKLEVSEHVTKGIENAGTAWLEMMKGSNTGKAIVQVADASN